MNEKNLPRNRLRFILHGLFYNAGIGISEPSTILPLIVNYFTTNNVIIGLFSSLLRGGSILMQLYAAFYTQAYVRVLKYLRIVFVVRFLSWFSMGLVLFFFSHDYPILTLWLFGFLLFAFSFSAGFGTIYFQELMGKLFTPSYRGGVIALRQILGGVGAVSSGFLAAYILQNFDKPDSFAYLFLVSSLFMASGYLSAGTVKEPEKKELREKENKFSEFFKHTVFLFKTDKSLRYQIFSRLLAFSFMFVAPFIILQAKKQIQLTGLIIGSFAAIQMSGALISNFIWGFLSVKNHNIAVVRIAYGLMFLALSFAFFAHSFWVYAILFFFLGASIDGTRLAFQNLILIIAPEKERPIYIAMQNNIAAIGLFFSIPGGLLVNHLGFSFTLSFALVLLSIGFICS
ncbi:MAG: MFS transporter, partial [Candidatus Zixiibacteriota bacterium]